MVIPSGHSGSPELQQRGGQAPSSVSFPLLKNYTLICLSSQLIVQLELHSACPSFPPCRKSSPIKEMDTPIA